MTKKSKSRVKPQSKPNKQRQPDSGDEEDWPCLARLALLGKTGLAWQGWPCLARLALLGKVAREVGSMQTVQEMGARIMHAGRERISMSQLRL